MSFKKKMSKSLGFVYDRILIDKIFESVTYVIFDMIDLNENRN